MIGFLGAVLALSPALAGSADGPAIRLPSKTETWMRLQTAHFTIARKKKTR